MTTKEECGDCRYWKPIGGLHGECLCNPPSIKDVRDENSKVVWPKTYEKRWCGKWEKKKTFQTDKDVSNFYYELLAATKNVFDEYASATKKSEKLSRERVVGNTFPRKQELQGPELWSKNKKCFKQKKQREFWKEKYAENNDVPWEEFEEKYIYYCDNCHGWFECPCLCYAR
jgi:hypothetical protein